MITFSKDRDGKWQLKGPASEMKIGLNVVTKKDGSTTEEEVVRLSKPFDKEGVQYVFGVLAPKEKGGASKTDDDDKKPAARPTKKSESAPKQEKGGVPW